MLNDERVTTRGERMRLRGAHRFIAAAVVAGVVGISATACTIGDQQLSPVAETSEALTTSPDGDGESTETSTTNAKPPKISIKDGATGVAPAEGVTVTSTSKLLSVTMKNEEGTEIEAEFNSDKSEWETTEMLGYGRTYTVEARNADGKTSTSKFSTVNPGWKASVAVGPLDGSTVGVAQAVTFRFGAPIQDTKAAEDAITVETSNDTEGGFFWIDPYELRWRPKEFWEPGTEVSVTTHLYGRNLGGDLWGGGDELTVSFTIGDLVETYVDNDSKTLSVYRDGELVKSFPVALGRDGQFDTPNGMYVVGDQHDSLVMDSRSYGLGLGEGGYVTPVNYATQMSYSGIYVHAAPWAVGDLGSRNVSHGCINATTEDAKWFMEYVRRGDPVIVENTSGGTLTPYDGLGYWNLDWEMRSGGSAEPLYE